MEDLTRSGTKIETPPEEGPEQTGGAINKQEPATDSFFGFIVDGLSKLPQSLLIAAASLIVVLAGILNRAAGPELSSTILYLVPVVLVTWFTRRSIGFIFSIFCALTWLVADLTSAATHINSDIPYWNGVARLGSFFILTFILSTLKSTLKQEKEYSRTDFLTGTRNRRYFIELLSMEIHRARRYDRPFTVVCIDLDNFKAANDCFGHSTGDMILRSVARTLQENIRVTDTVARLGGDEFAILLPETGRSAAETILRKIRKINLDIMKSHGWPVTLSIGVVTFARPPSTVDETLRKADRMMYAAKNNGKDGIRYEVYGTREWPAVTAA